MMRVKKTNNTIFGNRPEKTMNYTFLSVLLFATVCIVLGALPGSARAQVQGSWTMKAPIPLARNEVALAAVGGKVHVVGGGVKGMAGAQPHQKKPAPQPLGTPAP